MIIQINNKKLNVILCTSLISKLKGLMFRKIPKDGLLFDFKKDSFNHIHSLFVFYPINVIYINSKLEIIGVKKLKPFTFYFKGFKSRYILETNIEVNVGDKLRFWFFGKITF